MMTPKRLIAVIVTTGRTVSSIMAVVLPLAIVLAAISITGVAAAFTSSFVSMAGGNVFVLLILGAIACYVLGMIGMNLPGYVFLAVTFAPAVIEVGGLNPFAVHLFIIYYSMLAMITPPVAIGAFVAAGMAGASPMRTAFTSMGLAVVIYFIPFFFVFNPSLILQGSAVEAVYLFVLALLGILFIAGGLEGYLMKVGRLKFWARPLLVIAGILIGFPEWNTTFIGVALAVFIIAIMLIRKKLAVETS